MNSAVLWDCPNTIDGVVRIVCVTNACISVSVFDFCARQHYAIARIASPSVSVRPSDTRVDQSKRMKL